MSRSTLIASREQRRAHATNTRIAEVSAFAAKQKAKEQRKNARPVNAPTSERLAKGDLTRAPVYASNGFVEAHRYAERPASLLEPYADRLPEDVTWALARYVHDELVQESVAFGRLAIDHDRARVGRGAGESIGGAGRGTRDERVAFTRHEWVRGRLRSFDSPTGRVGVQDVLEMVLGYVRDGFRGQSRRRATLADIGRLLFPLRDEATAKGVALGTIQTLGKFLANEYLRFDALNDQPKPREPVRIDNSSGNSR